MVNCISCQLYLNIFTAEKNLEAATRDLAMVNVTITAGFTDQLIIILMSFCNVS